MWRAQKHLRQAENTGAAVISVINEDDVLGTWHNCYGLAVLWGKGNGGPEVIALPLPKPELARGQEAVASALEREGQAEGQQEYLGRMLQKNCGGSCCKRYKKSVGD